MTEEIISQIKAFVQTNRQTMGHVNNEELNTAANVISISTSVSMIPAIPYPVN